MAKFAHFLNSPTVSRVATVFMNNGLRQVLTLFISVSIARNYGAAGRGEYALFSSISTIIALILSLGLVNGLIYQLKLGNIQLKQAASLLFVHSSTAFLIVLAVLWAVGEGWRSTFFGDIHSLPVVVALFFLYYQAVLLNLLLTSSMLVFADMRNHRRQMVVIPVSTIATLLVGSLILGTEVFHPIYALVFGECTSAMYFMFRVSGVEAPIPKSRFPFHAVYAYSLRSYVSGLAGTVLSKVDNVVIGSFSGVEALGIYAAAKSFFQIVQSIPKAFSGYLLGLFVERDMAQGRRLATKAATVIFLIMSLVSLPLAIFPEWCIRTIYGAEYTPGATALQLLLAAAVIGGTSNPIMGYLLGNNRPGTSSFASLSGALVTIAILVALVPSLSYLGAGIAILCGAVALSAFRYAGFKLIYQNSDYS